MTTIRLRGLRDAIPAPALAAVTATVQRWAGRSPAPVFNGADVILPAEVSIDVNAQTITLPATDGRFCIRWAITGADVAPVIRYTAIPSAAVVDFADLIDVDPNTFKPTGAATTAWLAAIADVRDLAAAAAESAAGSGRSAFSAGQSAAVALAHSRSAEDGAIAAALSNESAAAHALEANTARAATIEARTDAGVAADDAEAARDDSRTARNAAQTARTDAIAARDDSRAARDESRTAQGVATTARDEARSARADAIAARDVSLAGQFAGADLTDTDLNTVYLPGVYRQPNTASAQVSRGYPAEAVSGMLVVLSRNNLNGGPGRAVQQFYPQIGAAAADARVHYARASNSSGWTLWRVFRSTRVDNPSTQPGAAVYLWNETGNTELQLQGTMMNLGSADLNSVTYPGTYYQSSSSQSTAARNYPIENVTTVLEVFSSSSVLATVFQRLTITGGSWGPVRGFHQRRMTNNVWGPWNFVPQHRVDNTAGRAMYSWDDTANREQLIYGDTGWREISTDLVNGWSGTSPTLLVRRNGWIVEYKIEGLNPTASTSAIVASALAPGFRPSGPAGTGGRFIVHTANTGTETITGYRAILDTSGVLTIRRNPASGALYGSITYLTSDAWPTSLPGTSIGSVPVA